MENENYFKNDSDNVQPGVGDESQQKDGNNFKLQDYVEKMLEAGTSKAQIKEQLMSVGWTEEQIDFAYSQALMKKSVPIPSETMQSTFGKKSSTIEIALNLFSFILLGITAISTGVLFYGIINKYFPDSLKFSYYSNNALSATIHYAIASLIISFPIYCVVMRLWFRSFEKDEGKAETKLTKWLTYLLLLIASVAIVGDLIAIVFTFLQGEISIRFFLKALTIIIIAGSIFTFYYLERQKIQYRKLIPGSIFKSFTIGASIIILFGIVLGFFAGGSPATERKRSFDRQRAKDLSSISYCISQYAKQYKKLPDSLSELRKTSYSYCANKKDPETKSEYKYKIIISSKSDGKNLKGEFELCGNFSLASELNGASDYGYYRDSNNWGKHTSGENCNRKEVILENFNYPKK